MEAERESVRLAVSLTLGVAAANYSFSTHYIHQESIPAISWIIMMAFAATWLICHSINCRIPCCAMAGSGFHGIGITRGRLMLEVLFAIAGAGIYAMEMVQTAALPAAQGPLKEFAYSCAGHIKEAIDCIGYKDPLCNAIVKAFLTGDRTGLDSHTREIFRISGASHLLALSGLHMGIIYIILSRALSLAGNSPAMQKTRSATIIAAAGLFTVMTGASASIVRAFLFILINETAKICGRKADGMSVLCTALMIQLAISPGIISSVSFQLSYLAMAGIITVYPVMQRMWPRPPAGHRFRFIITPMEKIWELCALSISCQLFTGPMAWWRFGTFPQYFLLTNLLCIPLMSMIMFSSIAVTAMTAFGTCPAMLTEISERLIASMISVLEIISSM